MNTVLIIDIEGKYSFLQLIFMDNLQKVGL